MSYPFTKIWGPGWEERILRRVQARNAMTVTEYAERRPHTPLVELATDLGEHVVAVQLEKLLFSEAKAANTVNGCIKSYLVRKLHEEIPDGWGCEDSDKRAASAYSSWATAIEMAIGEQYDDLAFEVFDRVRNTPPPPGWLPNDTDDPILVQAFKGANFDADCHSAQGAKG